MTEIVPYISYVSKLTHEVPQDLEMARIRNARRFFEHIRGEYGEPRTLGEVVSGWPSPNRLDTRIVATEDTIGFIKVGDGVRIGEPDYKNGCIYVFNVDLKLDSDRSKDLSSATIHLIHSPEVVVDKGVDRKGNKAKITRRYDLYNEVCTAEEHTIEGRNTNREYVYAKRNRVYAENWKIVKKHTFINGKKEVYYTYIFVDDLFQVRIWRDPKNGTIIRSWNDDGEPLPPRGINSDNRWWWKNGKIIYPRNRVVSVKQKAGRIKSNYGGGTWYYFPNARAEKTKQTT